MWQTFHLNQFDSVHNRQFDDCHVIGEIAQDEDDYSDGMLTMNKEEDLQVNGLGDQDKQVSCREATDISVQYSAEQTQKAGTMDDRRFSFYNGKERARTRVREESSINPKHDLRNVKRRVDAGSTVRGHVSK